MDYARDFLGLIGRIGIYHSPVHFSATYASPTTLSLAGAGLPTITDATQILGVVEFPASKARPRTYWAADCLTSYAAPILTVAGADFVSGSKFMVIIAGDTDVVITVPSDGLEVRGNTADRAELEAGAPLLTAGRNYVGAYAAVTMVSAGANNDIDFVARMAGVNGNLISVAFVQAATALTVSVVGNAITVTGNIAGGITANAVIAALRANASAMALVSCMNTAANDGSGNIDAIAATPLVGGLSGERAYVPHIDANGNSYEASAPDIKTAVQKLATETTVGKGLEVNQPTAADLNCTEASASSIKTAVEKVATETTAGDGVRVKQETASKLKATAVQPTAADLNMTEASAADMKTALQLIDDAVATFGAAAVAKGLMAALRASAGTPAAVADGQAVSPWASLTGALGTFLTQGLDYTTSSVTNRETSASGYAHGTRDCTVANTAYALAAASTPCYWVLMCAREANAGICITGGATITTSGGPVPKISVGCIGLLYVDDLAKVYVASSNAGDDVDFVYGTR